MRKRCHRVGPRNVHNAAPRLSRAAALIGAAGLALAAGLPALAQQSGGRPETPAAEAPVPAARDFTPPAPDASPAGQPDIEAPTYLIGPYIIRYAVEHPQYPALDDLMKTEVTLGRVETGLVRPGGGVPVVTYTLEELSAQPAQRYSTSALFAVAEAVRRSVAAEGIAAVTVQLSDREFARVDTPEPGRPLFTDLRPQGQTALTLVVQAATVSDVRTLAFGERVPFEQRINNRRHNRILDRSPVQPFHPDDEERRDLLRKDKLDDYVHRLNRHPGRRVDLGITAGEEPGTLVLDYYINENKPWLIYFQVSNTGTKQTTEWRERFGYTHNQLTGVDDILNIDYVTAGFDSSHAFNASYERPLWGEWLRGRVYGQWNQFTASDVGVQDQEFKGDGYAIGGELIANVYQYRELFIDVYGGARWQNIGIESSFGDTSLNDTEENFFITTVGTRLERSTDTQSTFVDLGIEFNLPDAADTEEDKVSNNFQRIDADHDWMTLQWDVTHSFFLEPLLIPSRWGNVDLSDPTASPTLAHEIALSLRGQHAFGDRLIPNFQQVAGGLYTVRGYPESAAAGDSLVIGSIEYRFHLPQALGFSEQPGKLFGQPFRYRPQAPYGRADWDLILKAFFDGARVVNNDRQPGEEDHTLLGTGVGMEFLFKRNLSIRVDWGVALEEIENEVSAGSNRFHISATILY